MRKFAYNALCAKLRKIYFGAMINLYSLFIYLCAINFEAMKLAAQIRQARMDLNITQKALAEMVNADPATISRIEKGLTKTPSNELLEKLGKVLKRNFILSSGEDIRTEEVIPVNFGFGHCLWAAPIIKGYCKDGGFPDIKVTSFGTKNDLGTLDPFWLGVGEDSQKNGIPFAGPILEDSIDLINRELADFNPLKSLDQEYEYEVYTADDLVQLVNKGLLTSIAVPREVYENNSAQLLRAASITYTTNRGCYLCLIGRVDLIDKLNQLDSPTPYDFIKEEFVNEVPLHSIYSERTISEKYFRKYISSFFIKEGLKIRPISMDYGRWERIEQTLKKLIDPSSGVNLFLMICWEPQLSWVQKWITETSFADYGFAKYDFSSILSNLKEQAPFVSFDILFKRDSIESFNQTQIRTINQFFNRIADNVTQLNRGDNPLDLMNEAVLISQYLNMDIDRTAEELYNINFRFSYYPDWVDWLLDHQKKF